MHRAITTSNRPIHMRAFRSKNPPIIMGLLLYCVLLLSLSTCRFFIHGACLALPGSGRPLLMKLPVVADGSTLLLYPTGCLAVAGLVMWPAALTSISNFLTTDRSFPRVRFIAFEVQRRRKQRIYSVSIGSGWFVPLLMFLYLIPHCGCGGN